jgi:hypothetical protein
MRKQNREESLLGFMTTLLLTVHRLYMKEI